MRKGKERERKATHRHPVKLSYCRIRASPADDAAVARARGVRGRGVRLRLHRRDHTTYKKNKGKRRPSELEFVPAHRSSCSCHLDKNRVPHGGGCRVGGGGARMGDSNNSRGQGGVRVVLRRMTRLASFSSAGTFLRPGGGRGWVSRRRAVPYRRLGGTDDW